MGKIINPIFPLDEFMPDVEARVFYGSDGQERLFLYGSHDGCDLESENNHGSLCELAAFQFRQLD